MWESLSVQEKNELILKILIHVTMSDLATANEEEKYLRHFCHSCGLNPKLIQIFSNDFEKYSDLLPHAEMERMQILYHMLFVINADGLINTQEERSVYKLAFKLGFHEAITKDFIELMKTYPINKLPKESMLAIIKKYSN
jgi:uncharacterized tellurite resistance protein B-like protein